MFFTGRFSLSQSSPPARNATYLGTFFLEFMSFERFYQPPCFFAARFTLRQPKTPVSNATNLRTSCFENYHYAFQETLCPVTLAHQIFVFYSNLYFFTSNTFRPFVKLPREIFFLSLMTLLLGIWLLLLISASKASFELFFFFNVYSFDTMEFSIKHKY